MDSNDDKPRNRLVRMLSYIVCLSKLSREWLSGLVRCSIPAIFLRSNCWVLLPHSLLSSHTVLSGGQELVGCPLKATYVAFAPRQSEFPLTLRLRWSPFAKGGWGIFTYATGNKHGSTRSALLAGSTMKDLPRTRGVWMGYKAYYLLC